MIYYCVVFIVINVDVLNGMILENILMVGVLVIFGVLSVVDGMVDI